MRIVNNFEKRCLTKSFVKDSTDPCDRDHQLFIISTSGFISWRHPVSMAEALCEIPCSTINNNCHHHKLRLLAPLLSVLRVNKGAIKTTHYTLQTITSSIEHIILKISLYYKFQNVLVPGYYKGVDASNVKTKKDLNENCHIWANFIKKFTNDTTN